MKRKQLLVVVLYICLILGCIGVVKFVSELGGSKTPGEPLQTESPLFPSETETDSQELATPADAETEAEPDSGGERNSWHDAYHHWQWQKPPEEIPEVPEVPYEPPVIMLASDLHYISRTTYDGGKAFAKMEAGDDGKISHYSDEIIDTLLAETIDAKPSALILSGDITHNGETENHLRLAEKLMKVQEAGIQVLVVPGNHDILNYNHASVYFGDYKEKTDYLEDADAFHAIYHPFGYDQAISRDSASLSYMYALDEYYWMLMIDSCQYEDYNHVNGRLKPETMAWITEQMDIAREQGIFVLPVAHHNLLSESRLYTTECTLENHLEVIKLLEEYEVPLYFSGHLHAQRIKKHKVEPSVPVDAYGITEIVLSPYCLSPNQYGVLKWDLAGNMSFETRKADVEAYARQIGSTDENLLNFHSYSVDFLKTVIKSQVIKTIHSVPDDLKEEMAQLYADLYFNYCAGNRMDQNQVTTERNYKLWQRVSPDSKYVKEMGQMMEDVKYDHHDWSGVSAGPGVTRESEAEETGETVENTAGSVAETTPESTAETAVEK